MAEKWRGNRQTISWFIDLYRRGLLALDPPYQRRSVWTQRYREDFVETILLGYPAPSLFLHEEIDSEGGQTYAVVDGKQRLTAVFDFIGDEYATRDDVEVKIPSELRGRYFKDLEPEVRRQFFAYEFTVEYVPTTDELLINEVFDRINRNVAKLSRQELRHARYSGVFAAAIEELCAELNAELPAGFPRIVESSKRQMKDVEFAAQLALLVERGPSTTGQDELDRVYATRDEDWPAEADVRTEFQRVVKYTASLLQHQDAADLASTRLRNQVDFYSLFGAIHGIPGEALPDPEVGAARLADFIQKVGGSEDEEAADTAESADATAAVDDRVTTYYNAARSAANDPSQRNARIEILRDALLGVG